MNRLYTWNFLLAFLAQTAFTITNSLLAHYGRWVEFLGGNELDVGNVSSVSAFFGLVFRPLLARGSIDWGRGSVGWSPVWW